MKYPLLVPAFTFLVGLTLSFLFLLNEKNHLKQENQANFKNLALLGFDRFEEQMDLNLESVVYLKSFYDSSSYVDPDEFHMFTRSALLKYKSIRALEWVPLITSENKEEMVDKIRKNYSHFDIVEKEGVQIIPVKERSIYYPVFYIEPYQGNEKILGFDLGSNSERLNALERSRDTGKMVLTSRIQLVQAEGEGYGFLAFMPIFQPGEWSTLKERRQQLKGFVLGVYQYKDILGSAYLSSHTEGVYFNLYDVTDGKKEFLVGREHAKNKHTAIEPEVVKYTLNNRQLLFEAIPTRDYVLTRSSKNHWFIFVLGLLLSAVFSLVFWSIRNHTEQVEAEVAQRTWELEESKKEIERVSRVRSEFLANMSHEIRTPMNGILGMTHFLLETNLASEQRDQVNTIHNSGKILLMLINDILDFSKMDAGKLEIENIPFDLKETIHNSIELTMMQSKNNKLELNIHVNENVPSFVYGDPVRLQQIIMNLVSNAIKFTEEGSVSVTVNSHHVGDRHDVKFTIEDTGMGISEAKINNIFEKFTQGDSSTTRKFGGTGLGLAICKQLVDLMGGTIIASNRKEGGAVFDFSIPFEEATREDVGEKDAVVAGDDRDVFNHRILLAEDNIVNQKVASKMIRAFGCTLEIAQNGQEALDRFFKEDFDLIFMDIQMPEMDGYDATQAIRQSDHPMAKSIPIVAMTANAMQGDREKCIDAGMNDYLSKPINKNSIKKALGKWLPKNLTN